MNDDDRFDEMIRDAARDLDPPPPPPREEMWARIQQARRAERTAVRPWAPRLARWTLPLAAALAIGVGIGRFTARDSATTPQFVQADPAVAVSDTAGSEPTLPYRVAAVQHLVRTEALLASLPEDARAGDVTEVSGWARDLLTNTRLLIDSPASEDPQLAGLLQDLELILAQIAALEGRSPAGELELIEDGIQRNDMLTRLRAATNARPFAGT